MMPTYVYRCEKCGDKFERFQGIKDPPVKKCDKCGGKVKRLIVPGAGFILKGSGFYETDYKQARSNIPCGNDHSCCGRETRCDKPPCRD
ncbi:FmdB family zinc ribbon protein [Acidobacteriota bacterium]